MIDQHSASRALEHMAVLTSAPRYMGSSGATRALDYLEERYRRLPGLRVWREPFTYLHYSPGSATLQLPSGAPLSGEPLAYGAGHAEGPLVDVGDATDRELASVQQAGRSLAGALWVSTNLRSFVVGPLAVRSRAAGLVLVSTVGRSLVRCGSVRLDRRSSTLPAISLSAEDGARVREQARRETRARLEVGGRVLPSTGENLVASLPASRKGSPLLVTAHYDSFWNGSHAMDNASGAAAVLTLAEALARQGPAGREVRFVAFGAEELGLWGSEAFAAAHATEPGSVGALLNFDTIGSVDSHHELSVTADLRLTVASLLSAHDIPVDVWNTPPRPGSDHESFTRRRVPTVWLANGGTDPYYHTPADTLSRIDPQRLQKALQIGAVLVDGLVRHSPALA